MKVLSWMMVMMTMTMNDFEREMGGELDDGPEEEEGGGGGVGVVSIVPYVRGPMIMPTSVTTIATAATAVAGLLRLSSCTCS
jgi:hypothetical protein